MTQRSLAPWRLYAVEVDGVRQWRVRDAADTRDVNLSTFDDVGEANARLIAVAPDLLEALIDCRHQFFGPPDGGWKDRMCAWIDAVIAKAVGDTTQHPTRRNERETR